MVLGRVPIGCSLRNSSSLALVEPSILPSDRRHCRRHTGTGPYYAWPLSRRPPLSILFWHGAVSRADDVAVMRERELLQRRDDFLYWLAHTLTVFIVVSFLSHSQYSILDALAKALKDLLFWKEALGAWCKSIDLCISSRRQAERNTRKIGDRSCPKIVI